MNIGTVSKLTGLSSKSIRLYEDKGIITPPIRSLAGYREYSAKNVQELSLIARAKNAGFSLIECKELVQLAQNPNRKSSEVKEKTKEKLDEIELKISELTEIKNQLESWVSACPGDNNSQCPIIEDLTK
ncbi:Cu(I)-responsive transcriptional regulator [Vibrio genomosp. F10]|uniref:HTH-type transcriptional regulator CueR n=2 Tax=Vibrio genomosp. F10 TaxID=723171 RepID=A0A1B9QYE3_9VIBR|nr:Cu(I)-responsive transcriptional regulator [Vibrio genomosp. F10]OCH75313.1 Cu(I)-responsive transcriptional regulator [Vibrio genomosp. F10]OEE36028.1 Cu(I)-responsive transcriptional regulator [Vibrio genomosp. F10 str. ZF-129]OEE94919.1 Cu(I)-responsive transcriptional regulator [Vibrio genomosp. F10 str. 9ZD137]OEE96713.1 Cu(I)-responsive transcriptional regulator [Vibrio genomosp. F10 str. 9ZC157]